MLHSWSRRLRLRGGLKAKSQQCEVVRFWFSCWRPILRLRLTACCLLVFLSSLRVAWTTPAGSHASQKPARTLMKSTVVRRIVAVLALALAGTQVASGQLPPSSPPATSPAAPPQHLAAPLGKPGDLPPDGQPGAVPDSQSKDAARVAPQQTQRLAPTAPSRPVDRPATAGGADRFRFKADVDLVLVEATVRDQDGGIVNNLRRESFRVYENGVEQRISYFSRDELPLAVALVLDCSGSMGPVLKQLHRVAFDTLSSLKPDDQVALFDFAARAEMLVGLTRNRQRIADAIATIRAGGGTVIPDALLRGRALPRPRGPGPPSRHHPGFRQ